MSEASGSAGRRPNGHVDPVKFCVCLAIVLLVGAALYMTRRQLETTSCEVGPNERMVLYGGEGNKARILPPGQHPLAGFSYESDYVVPMGEVTSSFEVRIAQSKLATFGHTLMRNRWTRDTAVGEMAEALTPQPIFLNVKLVYDLDEFKLQKLVDACNDQPFEEGILPGLVNDAFMKASKEQNGGLVRSFFSSDTPSDPSESPEVVAGMRERIEKMLRKRFDITLKEFEIVESQRRDLTEDEPVRPAYKTARPAPQSATIKTPPTFGEAVMENIERIIGFLAITAIIIGLSMVMP